MNDYNKIMLILNQHLISRFRILSNRILNLINGSMQTEPKRLAIRCEYDLMCIYCGMRVQ